MTRRWFMMNQSWRRKSSVESSQQQHGRVFSTATKSQKVLLCVWVMESPVCCVVLNDLTVDIVDVSSGPVLGQSGHLITPWPAATPLFGSRMPSPSFHALLIFRRCTRIIFLLVKCKHLYFDWLFPLCLSDDRSPETRCREWIGYV